MDKTRVITLDGSNEEALEHLEQIIKDLERKEQEKAKNGNSN